MAGLHNLNSCLWKRVGAAIFFSCFVTMFLFRYLEFGGSQPGNPGAIWVREPKFFDCFDKPNGYRLYQKGRFWVLHNYIRARRWFACHESVTLTTVCDPRYLNETLVVVERWKGPMSVAVYTPGTDLQVALAIIGHLRSCSPLVAEYVSFHVFFESEHKPPVVPPHRTLQNTQPAHCAGSELHRMVAEAGNGSYRIRQRLAFPINVARNVARDAATTHFILASDIELYPSLDIAPRFLAMIRRNPQYVRPETPAVFVVPMYRLRPGISIPNTKAELLDLIFHNSVRVERCPVCQRIPNPKIWYQAKKESSSELRVIDTTKRKRHWEPYYIGTNDEPYFDERQNVEDKCDKILQAHLMCLLDYDFHILDAAFLVHNPTPMRKVKVPPKWRPGDLIRFQIEPDIKVLYERNSNCSRGYRSCMPITRKGKRSKVKSKFSFNSIA